MTMTALELQMASIMVRTVKQHLPQESWTPFTVGWRPRLQDLGRAFPPSTLLLVGPRLPFPAVMLGIQLTDVGWEVSLGSLSKGCDM